MASTYAYDNVFLSFIMEKVPPGGHETVRMEGLDSAKARCDAFGKVLSNRFGYITDSISCPHGHFQLCVRNEEVTHDSISKTLQGVSRIRIKNLIIYVHMSESSDGSGYLLPWDASPRPWSGWFPIKDLKKAFNDSPVENLLIILVSNTPKNLRDFFSNNRSHTSSNGRFRMGWAIIFHPRSNEASTTQRNLTSAKGVTEDDPIIFLTKALKQRQTNSISLKSVVDRYEKQQKENHRDVVFDQRLITFPGGDGNKNFIFSVESKTKTSIDFWLKATFIGVFLLLIGLSFYIMVSDSGDLKAPETQHADSTIVEFTQQPDSGQVAPAVIDRVIAEPFGNDIIPVHGEDSDASLVGDTVDAKTEKDMESIPSSEGPKDTQDVPDVDESAVFATTGDVGGTPPVVVGGSGSLTHQVTTFIEAIPLESGSMTSDRDVSSTFSTDGPLDVKDSDEAISHGEVAASEQFVGSKEESFVNKPDTTVVMDTGSAYNAEAAAPVPSIGEVTDNSEQSTHDVDVVEPWEANLPEPDGNTIEIGSLGPPTSSTSLEKVVPSSEDSLIGLSSEEVDFGALPNTSLDEEPQSDTIGDEAHSMPDEVVSQDVATDSRGTHTINDSDQEISNSEQLSLEEPGMEAESLIKESVPQVQLDMVVVPTGTIKFPSPFNQDIQQVSEFLISKTEMTSEVASALINYGIGNEYLYIEDGFLYIWGKSSYFKLLDFYNNRSLSMDENGTTQVNSSMGDYPVTGLSWYGAVTLCDLLSLSQGLEPYYQVFSYDPSRNDDSSGYRLPTPEQWYHAASNGDGTTRYAGSDVANAVGVFYPESLHKVGSKIPNSLGIFDLSGNVREFCDDHDFAYLSGVELISNPTIPVRGGSFSTLPNHQTIERHDFVKPTHTFDDIGVRPVKPSV